MNQEFFRLGSKDGISEYHCHSINRQLIGYSTPK